MSTLGDRVGRGGFGKAAQIARRRELSLDEVSVHAVEHSGVVRCTAYDGRDTHLYLEHGDPIDTTTHPDKQVEPALWKRSLAVNHP